MFERFREKAAIFGDDWGADVAIGVAAVHGLWFMAFVPGIENPTWYQLVAFVSAIVVTMLLGWNARKLDPENRHQWLKLLAAWAVFALVSAASLSAILYPGADSVTLADTFGYRVLALIWAGSAFSVFAVGVAHFGYAIRVAIRGRRSSDEITEDVLEGEDDE